MTPQDPASAVAPAAAPRKSPTAELLRIFGMEGLGSHMVLDEDAPTTTTRSGKGSAYCLTLSEAHPLLPFRKRKLQVVLSDEQLYAGRVNLADLERIAKLSPGRSQELEVISGRVMGHLYPRSDGLPGNFRPESGSHRAPVYADQCERLAAFLHGTGPYAEHGGLKGFLARHKDYQAWLVGGDTGLSSEYLAAALLGLQPCDDPMGRVTYPHDGEDLGRCMRMLRACPGVKAEFGRAVRLPAPWPELAKAWPELEALWDAGQAPGAGKAERDKLYERLKTVIPDRSSPAPAPDDGLTPLQRKVVASFDDYVHDGNPFAYVAARRKGTPTAFVISPKGRAFIMEKSATRTIAGETYEEEGRTLLAFGLKTEHIVFEQWLATLEKAGVQFKTPSRTTHGLLSPEFLAAHSGLSREEIDKLLTPVPPTVPMAVD